MVEQQRAKDSSWMLQHKEAGAGSLGAQPADAPAGGASCPFSSSQPTAAEMLGGRRVSEVLNLESTDVLHVVIVIFSTRQALGVQGRAKFSVPLCE
ncbi:UNVERIFIED_CONTAM: hypothetical protein K2H54_067463 [Gekko kuhli]